MAVLCFLYPVYIIYYVNKRNGKLQTRWAKWRFGELFSQIKLDRSPGAKYYHALFLMRRVVVCLLPVLGNETNIYPYLILLICH